jgi:uncharacterized phiE125 gp8 family phage protein
MGHTMSTRLIAPPAALAVSMEAARETLRVDDDSLDMTIEQCIKGITIEAEHATGRAFVNRSYRLTLDEFPDAVRLPHAPTFSVESISFIDVAGELQVLDPADYYVDKETEPGYIVPGRGKRWPATLDQVNAVRVDYTAGYGPDDTTVPDSMKTYILAKLQVQFEIQAGAGSVVSKPFNVEYLDRLLDHLRVYG